MGSNLLFSCGSLALAFPFIAIAAILVHYWLRHALWKSKGKRGKKCRGFCPSSSALGALLLLSHMFYRPSMAHQIEARQDVGVEEDDQGDPENTNKEFHRQLHLIRSGERFN
jgi:hypothetical protein